MDASHDNPILRPAFASGTVPMIPSQPCGPKPTQNSARKAPPAIRKLISELGFRYRPTSADDVKVHAAKLDVLAEDLADVPEVLLRQAIGSWVRRSPFLPKASDLIALAQEAADISKPKGRQIEVNGEMVPTDIHEYCAWLNAKPCFAGQWSVKMQPSGKLGIERGRAEA